MAVEDEVKAAEEQQDKEMDTETAAQGDESGDKPEAEGKMDQDGEDDDDSEHRRRGEDAEETTKPAEPAPLDREKTCPLLLRMFCREGGHHRMEDYRGPRTPAEELQIYTWMDATLKEISTLIKEVNVSARRKGARISIATVYKDARGVPSLRVLGDLTNGEESAVSERSLKDLNFRIGDYMDIAIYNQRRRDSAGTDLERPPRAARPAERDDRRRDHRRDNDGRRDRRDNDDRRDRRR